MVVLRKASMHAKSNEYWAYQSLIDFSLHDLREIFLCSLELEFVFWVAGEWCYLSGLILISDDEDRMIWLGINCTTQQHLDGQHFLRGNIPEDCYVHTRANYDSNNEDGSCLLAWSYIAF